MYINQQTYETMKLPIKIYITKNIYNIDLKTVMYMYINSSLNENLNFYQLVLILGSIMTLK